MVAEGLVPDRPPAEGKMARARRLMLSPRGRAMTIKAVAREIGLAYRNAKQVHSRLVAAGLLEPKRTHPNPPPPAHGSDQ